MNGLEESILIALRRIIRAVDLHSHRLEEACGLTGPQLLLLREIERAGSISAGALARAAKLSQATVTGILDRLERRQLVTRRRDTQDRRSVLVDITPQAREILGSNPSLLQDQFTQRLKMLKDWEETLILSTLQRIAALMEADDLDASPVLITGSVGVCPDGLNDDPAADSDCPTEGLQDNDATGNPQPDT